MAESTFPDEWLSGTIAELIGVERLDELRAMEQPEESLWETVVAQTDATDEDVLNGLSTRFRLKVANLGHEDRAAQDLVPEQVSRRYLIVPMRVTDSYLEIATANPFDLDCEKTLAFATGREVRVALAAPAAIRSRIDELYRPENAIDQLLEGMESAAEITQIEDEDETDELNISAEEASQRPVVRMVDLILSEGILSRASDIHIEPEEGGVAVRYRIDGVLRQVMKIPRTAGLPLISRFKIIASLDIADRLRPQDGRARVAVNAVPVDLRISTLPASLGEKVVVRILDSSRTVLSLESLGLSPSEQTSIKELLDYRDGVILVTGPTGSGKTTTLYSAIRHIQSEGVNIVTVEDPVEYRLQGIVQVQVHEKAGLTFAAALRSILRQDPDVVLVGEIRDMETAQIAIQASLTGHLVLSTLHTNDAPNAVTRLMDIGVEGFKIATAIRGIVAQRLMRKLCGTCKEPLTDPAPDKLNRWIPKETKLSRAVGCPECAMTGYRGRFSIVEVLKTTPEVERVVGLGENADVIAEAARKGGMKTLWDSGLAHVLSGESTIEELLRVVDMPPEDESKRRRSSPGSKVAGRATPAGGSDVAKSESAAPAPVQDAPAGPAVTMSPAAQAAPPVVQPVVIQQVVPAEQQAPAPHAPPAPLRVDFELVESETDTPRTTPAGGLEKKGTVLLVDDEDQLRKVMCDLLERDGFVVIEARDGAEALDQVDRHAPNIIVLDLNLPGLDGYSVLTQLRSRATTENIPIIVLTAKGDEDNEVRVFELGADDFMSKPFRAKALSARLSALLSRSRRN